MQDRVPVNPGRVLITPENGSAAYYATMTRADNPTQEGTPLNKNSFLKDQTAELLGLNSSSVPDDALVRIKELIDAANAYTDTKAKIVTGSYTGTGKSGSSNPNSLTFDSVPKMVLMLGYKTSSTIKFLTGWESSNTTDRYHAMFPEMLTTSYVENVGFGQIWNSSLYGKRSADGKTIYWYNTSSDAFYQYNSSSVTFYYAAIF